MRVGINTGFVVAGAIGCDLKLEYTSIGETTNLAQRMETACKIGHVLISENTYRVIEGKDFGAIDISPTSHEEKVKGYSKPVKSYDILVHNQIISKNSSTDDLRHYYRYETLK